MIKNFFVIQPISLLRRVGSFILGIVVVGSLYHVALGLNGIPIKDPGDAFTAEEFNQILDDLEGVYRINGNVGIGILPSSHKLQVNGAMNVTGSITSTNLTSACGQGYFMKGFNINGSINCFSIDAPQAPLDI